MRDPFRPNSNKQLIREAQMGFAVIGSLVAILIYVVYFRTHQFGDEWIGQDFSKTVATKTVSEPSLETSAASAKQNNAARPLTDRDRSLEVPRRLLAKTESTSRKLNATAKTIRQSIAEVQTLSSVPVQPDSIGLVGNPAAAQTVEPPALNRELPPGFQATKSSGRTLASLEKQNQRSPEGFTSTFASETNRERPTPFAEKPLPAPFAASSPETGFEPVPQKQTSAKATKPEKLQQDDVSMIGMPRVPVAEKVGSNEFGDRVAKAEPTSALIKPEPVVTTPIVKDETVKAVSFQQQSTWVVKKGDSFWSIAQTHYGDGRFYNALYQENRKTVPGFEDLAEGIELKLPTTENLLKTWPQFCPADVVHKDDPWRTTPDDLMEGLKLKCDAELQKRFYTSVEGDTLFRIAQRRLGQASRYVELLELNEFRLASDVTHDAELPPGTRILLPAK